MERETETDQHFLRRNTELGADTGEVAQEENQELAEESMRSCF